MPTYEYRCGACEHRFERLQKFSDDPVRTCPECGEDEAERLISPGAGLVFKGSGFYETDYKRKSRPGASGGEDAGTGKGGGEGSGSGGDSGGGTGASGEAAGGGSAAGTEGRKGGGADG